MSQTNKEYLGMTRFWRFIKSQRKDYFAVSTLRENGKTTYDPKERAYILNRQFESVFIQEEHIPSDLLPNTSPYPIMKDIQITELGVLKMLERLKPHKAMGPDEVGPRVLKELSSTIAPILTVIYRRS